MYLICKPLQITLTVQAQLPAEQVYECVFGSYGNTPASVQQTEENKAIVKCQTPIVQPVTDRECYVLGGGWVVPRASNPQLIFGPA